MSETKLIPAERIERQILLLRGHKVMLDFQLAELYGVATKVLNQAGKRNLERFPEDFMLRLSDRETELVIRTPLASASKRNWSQIVTSSRKHRGLAYRPYAFTEQGVAMLSGVLHSPRAVRVNIEIMRAFVRLRQMLATNAVLSGRLDELEKNYDGQFRLVFDAIRRLMKEVRPSRPRPRREIGFHTLRENGAVLSPRRPPKGPVKYRIRRFSR
jgi:hypothetical protein